jgi:prolyl-tRNA editing enzyme YbaK/EbsC (Cys-tRNA(Pro) deacylase)
MWPPEVERVAELVRAAGVEARLEELPQERDALPGAGVRALAYDCAGETVVVLLPVDRRPDADKIAAAAGCRNVVPVAAPPFPFAEAKRVLVEQILFATPIVWIHAASPRHVLVLDPSLLARFTRGTRADIVQRG